MARKQGIKRTRKELELLEGERNRLRAIARGQRVMFTSPIAEALKKATAERLAREARKGT